MATKQRRSPRQQGSHSPVHAAAPVVQDEGVWPAVDPELLPTLAPVMRGVVKALGYARARVFLEQYGGTVIYIPKQHSNSLNLSDAELQRLNISLKQHIHTQRGLISVPKADKLFLKFRNEQIMRDRQRMSLTKVAKKNKLTTRQVMYIQRDFEDSNKSFAEIAEDRMQFLLC